jgi:2-amino-4-hydroxy-6-hydroxymethyldihydropteridine diphosphokinase
MTHFSDRKSFKTYEAIIALGSNIGDRIGYFERALRWILQSGDSVPIECSKWYITEPVGGPEGQGSYLNGAIAIKTKLSPQLLLEQLLTIESTLGRNRLEKNGPRTIDLDIILYENHNMQTESITLPHPRFTERPFVLCPLRDLFQSKALKSTYWIPFKTMYQTYDSEEGVVSSLDPSPRFLRARIPS